MNTQPTIGLYIGANQRFGNLKVNIQSSYFRFLCFEGDVGIRISAGWIFDIRHFDREATRLREALCFAWTPDCNLGLFRKRYAIVKRYLSKRKETQDTLEMIFPAFVQLKFKSSAYSNWSFAPPKFELKIQNRERRKSIQVRLEFVP